eukprot:SAG31_NODE_21_length_34109_cov_60.598824_25_plen_234_part_00
MVPGPPEMEAVALGDNGIVSGLRPGCIYVDHTTTSPTLITKVESAVKARGASMVDAPVMGDRASIENGVLTMLIGCEDGLEKARVWSVVERFSDRQMHMGALGTGTAAKLALNMLPMSIDVLLAECLTLGVKAGVELDALLSALDAIQLFGPSCSIYRRFPQTLFKGKFVPSRFYLKLAHKDYRLVAEMASTLGVPTRLISMCEQEHLGMSPLFENRFHSQQDSSLMLLDVLP